MELNNYTIFPTIISHLTCDNFDLVKSDLVDWIYNFKSNNCGTVVSNRGGWQSFNDFYHEDLSFDFYFNYIKTHIDAALQFYNINFAITELWINVNKPGDYNISHNHHRLMSGVLWVQAPENCGHMTFESPDSYNYAMMYRHIDPQIVQDYNYCSSYTYAPQEGSMLFFPSSLRHSVGVNESNSDRISITFNLDQI